MNGRQKVFLGLAILLFGLGGFAVYARVQHDRAAAAAEDRRRLADRDVCNKTTAVYRAMAVDGRHSWQGRPIERIREDVLSCERAGHVKR